LSISIDLSIFRGYDIRGVYPDQLNEKIAYNIGRAIVTYLNASKLVVGKDMRISSPSLQEAVIKGIIDQGADVVDIGLVSSDMFYYACGEILLPGLSVTASHNPKEYNGFKMVKQMPELIRKGDGMEEIAQLVCREDFPKTFKKGTVSNWDIKDGYRQKILSLVDISKIQPMKIVVDAANGMGGVAFDLVSSSLPLEIIKLYFEPDGNFPNHGGDPLIEENRRELQNRVVTEKAALGFAFDPDADRFFAIDSKGGFVPGDFMTALLGKYFVEKGMGKTVVYDTRASWVIRDTIAHAGGNTVETRIGHAFIKAKIKEVNGVFAGEITGHYYFPQFYFADSGVLPALFLLEMLGHYRKSLDELLKEFETKYFISGEINFRVKSAEDIMKTIEEKYKSSFKILKIDGITIVGDDWHANIRSSNTEPLLRLNVEGLTHERMIEKLGELKAIITA
jgi:phosphomannomutase